jgi:hypothetical protein
VPDNAAGADAGAGAAERMILRLFVFFFLDTTEDCLRSARQLQVKLYGFLYSDRRVRLR